MIKRIIRNNLRRPLYSLAVILFAAVLAVVLCYLHKAGEEELRSFEETYASVPVFFKVTDLDGSKVPLTDLSGDDYVVINGGIQGWTVDLFTDRGLQPNLSPYVKEMHIRTSLNVKWSEPDPDRPNHPIGITYDDIITGITSTYVAEELTEGWGGKIYWYPGYDESVLNTQELVCLVPESMKEQTELDLYFYCYVLTDTTAILKDHNEVLKIVGYYTDPGNSRIYCPYPVMQKVFAHMGVSKRIEELGAILNDNSKIELLKEDAALWFAEPNPLGEKTEWGRFGYDFYLYALDIDDTMLHNLETNMKNSMLLNQLAALIVFILSAGAGFLTGFLVIRSRKREIAIMRTLGASHASIFAELALEQLFCVFAGIIVGGSYSLWQPVDRLSLFGAIYFMGLTVALIVFLRKNLLTTIKEDE